MESEVIVHIFNQARRFVGPDLVPNCLHKMSADYTRR